MMKLLMSIWQEGPAIEVPDQMLALIENYAQYKDALQAILSKSANRRFTAIARIDERRRLHLVEHDMGKAIQDLGLLGREYPGIAVDDAERSQTRYPSAGSKRRGSIELQARTSPATSGFGKRARVLARLFDDVRIVLQDCRGARSRIAADLDRPRPIRISI